MIGQDQYRYGGVFMTNFKRNDPWLSLCGLNCGLCSMHLGGHCGGCGFGNQSCKIARCSIERGGVEYCSQCGQYPCSKYDGIDQFDSFITHQNRSANLKRIGEIGTEAYQREQMEKAKLLDVLLSGYNDGRRKTLFCLAVNLLEISELERILQEAEGRYKGTEATLKEKASGIAELLHASAKERNIVLKLRKK